MSAIESLLTPLWNKWFLGKSDIKSQWGLLLKKGETFSVTGVLGCGGRGQPLQVGVAFRLQVTRAQPSLPEAYRGSTFQFVVYKERPPRGVIKSIALMVHCLGLSLAPPFPGCALLGKSLNFSLPYFKWTKGIVTGLPHEVVVRVKWENTCKTWRYPHVHRKCLINIRCFIVCVCVKCI